MALLSYHVSLKSKIALVALLLIATTTTNRRIICTAVLAENMNDISPSSRNEHTRGRRRRRTQQLKQNNPSKSKKGGFDVSVQDRSLVPPVDSNGKRIAKNYRYKETGDGLRITTRYNEDSIARISKSKKGKRYGEEMEWDIRSNEEGLTIKTKYSNQNEEMDVKTSITAATLKIVEFVKDDPNDSDEVYIDQPVVTEHFFSQWQPPVLEGGCSSAMTPCRAIFMTVDQCLTVIATSNIADAIQNGRFQMDPDDVKFDYVFGDSCTVTDDHHGLAVVGKVNTESKTRVKRHHKQQQPQEASTIDVRQLEGVQSESDQGISLFLSWIDEIDCTEVTDASGSPVDHDLIIPIDMNGTIVGGPLDQSDVQSVIAQQIDQATQTTTNNATTTTPNTTIAIPATPRNMGNNTNAVDPNIRTTPRTRPVNVYTYTDIDQQTGNLMRNQQIIQWTIGKTRQDRGCVWDPVVGVIATDDDSDNNQNNYGTSTNTVAFSTATILGSSSCIRTTLIILGSTVAMLWGIVF